MRALANNLGGIGIILGVVLGIHMSNLTWSQNVCCNPLGPLLSILGTFYLGLTIATLPFFVIRHILLPKRKTLGIGLVLSAIALGISALMETDGFKAIGLFAMLYVLPHIIDLICDMRVAWKKYQVERMADKSL